MNPFIPHTLCKCMSHSPCSQGSKAISQNPQDWSQHCFVHLLVGRAIEECKLVLALCLNEKRYLIFLDASIPDKQTQNAATF